MNSPEPNYPRGIVNPNYPGFQHLAHTLSEYFVDQPTTVGSMSDSDISDFEYDLSIEKQLENIKNSYRLDNQNNNDYYNNRNNKNNNYDESNCNNIDNKNFNNNKNRNGTQHVSNLCRVEALLKDALESPTSELPLPPPPMDDGEDDVDFFALANENQCVQNLYEETSNIKERNSELKKLTSDAAFNAGEQTEIIACDLETYLKRYNERGSYLSFENKSVGKKSPASPIGPPDILEQSIVSPTKVKSENIAVVKPDILQMIDNSKLDDVKFSNQTIASFFDSEIKFNETGAGGKASDDNCQWSITPVDIVGNFEQEVQREFGLLMSGYKNKNVSDENQSADDARVECFGPVHCNLHEKVSKIH